MKTEEATLSIPPNSAAIAGARRFTEGFLATHGLRDLADTLVLLVSEVVTNAILHGGSGAELRLILSDGKLRAEVRDSSHSLPSVKQYSDSATTGRGMLIVESLAEAWGTDTYTEGKVVWFTVDASGYVTEPGVPDGSGISLKGLQTSAGVDPVYRSTRPDDKGKGGSLGLRLSGALFS